jgi:colanic acid biosynthesis glycosyl transferase WcaI
MRVFLHDFAGHPFQAQLSRELAAKGHEVAHAYSADIPGPKGRLAKAETDPKLLEFRPLRFASSKSKYSPLHRLIAHRTYAADLRAFIRDYEPDVVVSGNTPIDVQAELLRYCRKNHVGFVHWVQDVYCEALQFFLRRKLGWIAQPLAHPFRKLELWVARNSSAAVVIAPAFRDLFVKWDVAADLISVIENWAPLEEVPLFPRSNCWSNRYGLTGKTVFLYSGTLGLKHRPELLYGLAQSLDDNCKVVVITEGIGREYLERMPKLENLLIMNFQPYEELPQVLATADVLVATLEPDAGHFAVPSKILTYLCAGRPILLAAPKGNLGTSVVERSGAGLVVDGDDRNSWLQTAQRLVSDPVLRITLGGNARQYAEKTFDITRIASAFEEILLRVRSLKPVSESVQSKVQTEA